MRDASSQHKALLLYTVRIFKGALNLREICKTVEVTYEKFARCLFSAVHPSYCIRQEAPLPRRVQRVRRA